MKIKNEYIKIKIGNKEKSFHNLILDSYLELFAESLIELNDKRLECCLINYSHPVVIDPIAIRMDYDMVFYETNF